MERFDAWKLNLTTLPRDHSRECRTAKATLKPGDGDTLPNGKRRRCNARYGEYEL